MSNGMKLLIWSVVVMTVAAVAGAVLLGFHISAKLNAKKMQAVQIAKDYLSRQYEQEMQYMSVRYSSGLVGPELYRVYFSPINNPDLVVEVRVFADLSITEPRSYRHQEHDSGNYITRDSRQDNYYIVLFQWLAAEYYSNDVKNIWGDNTIIDTSTNNLHGGGSFNMPHGLNDNMSFSEMVELGATFLLKINIDLMLDDKQKESERMLEFIKIVQDSGYKPSSIFFNYRKPKTMNDISGILSVIFLDWEEITTVEQVLAVI